MPLVFNLCALLYPHTYFFANKCGGLQILNIFANKTPRMDLLGEAD